MSTLSALRAHRTRHLDVLKYSSITAAVKEELWAKVKDYDARIEAIARGLPEPRSDAHARRGKNPARARRRPKPEDDGCVHCTRKLALVQAHSRDGTRIFTLCWYCQWLYDEAILTELEIIAAERQYRAGTRRVKMDLLFRRIEEELAAGIRQKIPRHIVQTQGIELMRRGLA